MDDPFRISPSSGSSLTTIPICSIKHVHEKRSLQMIKPRCSKNFCNREIWKLFWFVIFKKKWHHSKAFKSGLVLYAKKFNAYFESCKIQKKNAMRFALLCRRVILQTIKFDFEPTKEYKFHCLKYILNINKFSYWESFNLLLILSGR